MISKKALLNFINLFPEDTWFLPVNDNYDGTIGIAASNSGYHQLGFIHNTTEKVELSE